MSRLFTSIVCVAGLLSASAIAQDSKAPATTPAPVATAAAPKHSCKQPERPNQFATENQQKAFIKEVDAYRDCLMAFRSEMNEKAKAYVEAANKAIEEFNGFAESLRKK